VPIFHPERSLTEFLAKAGCRGVHRAGRKDPGTGLADLRPRWPAERVAPSAGRHENRHRHHGATTVGDLQVTQVIDEARAVSAIVVTHDPDRYAAHRLDVVDLRP
jgi:hypothetical protein